MILDKLLFTTMSPEKAFKTKAEGRRVALLRESDWTQLPNAPLTDEKKAEWEVYRQALRDITKQEKYPFEITWPNIPQ